MQEDKEATFDALDALSLALAAMAGMVRDLSFNRERMRASAATGFSTATDLADWLVRELGLPFRDAHHVTGRLVALAEEKGCGLDGLTIEDMKTVEPNINSKVFGVLSVEKSVASRTSFGGTAPKNVEEQARLWKEKLAKL
jgi:argininosuccinate lyase